MTDSGCTVPKPDRIHSQMLSWSLRQSTRRYRPVCLNLLQSLKIVNVYAPNMSKDRREFFDSCFQSITSSSIVLGDFNSVEENSDCISGRLDSMSHYLSSLIHSQNLVEQAGSQ